MPLPKTPQSFGTLNLNDTSYTSVLLDAAGQPEAQIQMADRMGTYPLYIGQKLQPRTLTLHINMLGDNAQDQESRINTLYQTLSTAKDSEQQLIVEDASGIRKYVDATVETAAINGQVAIVRLSVANPIWKDYHLTESTWEVTDTGGTSVFNNTGSFDTNPVYDIKCTTADASAQYPYARPIQVYNRSEKKLSNYPVEITGGGLNTKALVDASKMRSDGYDLRIFSNGKQIDRWLDGMNTTSTKIWVNLDFKPNNPYDGWQVKTGFLGTDTTITLFHPPLTNPHTFTGNLPYNGFLVVGTERMFVRRTKDSPAVVTDTGKTREAEFNIVKRGTHNTTATSHSSGDDVYFIDNDLWMVYGYASEVEPIADGNDKPMFNLSTSTNTSWDYDDFAEVLGISESGVTLEGRSATWRPMTRVVDNSGNLRAVYANDTAQSGTFEMASDGLEVGVVGTRVYCPYWLGAFLQGLSIGGIDAWVLDVPCGFTAMTAAGFVYQDTAFVKYVCQAIHDDSHKITVYGESPHSPSSWTAFSVDWGSGAADRGEYHKVIWFMEHVATDTTAEDHYGEITDCTFTLQSTLTPSVTLGSETADSFYLNCTLTNNTTGDYVKIEYPVQVAKTVRLDTGTHEVLYLRDNENIYRSFQLSSVRKDWLKLQPGNNTLQLDDVNLADTGQIDVTVKFRNQWL